MQTRCRHVIIIELPPKKLDQPARSILGDTQGQCNPQIWHSVTQRPLDPKEFAIFSIACSRQGDGVFQAAGARHGQGSPRQPPPGHPTVLCVLQVPSY